MGHPRPKCFRLETHLLNADAQLFFSPMPPFVVATFNSRPPAPTVPERVFGPNVPCTVIGKSELIPPLVVLASTLNSAEAGSVTSTLPLVVISSNSPLHLALPMDTRTPPLVVFAEAHWLVETSTLPLVVAASTTLSRLTQWTPPLVVIALRRTPGGTCTSKLIFARWLCPQFQLLDSEETPPRWQRPGALSFA